MKKIDKLTVEVLKFSETGDVNEVTFKLGNKKLKWFDNHDRMMFKAVLFVIERQDYNRLCWMAEDFLPDDRQLNTVEIIYKEL